MNEEGYLKDVNPLSGPDFFASNGNAAEAGNHGN